MYIPWSACHRLWKVIQFSHIHNVLEIRRGDEEAGNMVTWHLLTCITLKQKPISSTVPTPPPPRPWLCSRLWGLEWSSTVSFLSSENGRETGHTPSVRLLDEGTADSFIKRTWDSSPTPVLKSQLLSITQCVTLNRHNLAESFLSLTFLVTYYTWYTHSCDGYKRLCENAWHTIHFLTYYRFLTNVTWLSLWGSHRLMKTCTLFPFARLNALNSGSE